jgi:hypothetical protein
MLRCTAILTAGLLLTMGCSGKKATGEAANADTGTVNVPRFNQDSAYKSIVDQCNFGPRTPGSKAHEQCGAYIIAAFKRLGLTVTKQEATFTRYDGVKMKGYNIIAQTNPQASGRILLAAHWDSRPWADQDPDPKNQKQPVPAANDGASGVAVMLEIARQLTLQKPAVAVDFVCFDAEDAGTPEWESADDDESTWCLGSQYWAARADGSRYRYGILLDMVGGQGARFYQEGFSKQYAADVQQRIWQAASTAGYSSFFPTQDGGFITDDHLPVNRTAKIKMVDIVPYYPAGTRSFGPTWHTLDDTPENIDPAVLQAVGQTLLQLIYNEH